MRWQHPRLGLIYSDAFIEMAETTGFIKPLTQVVLRLAMKQIRDWGNLGFVYPVAVNISAINLQDRSFPESVAALMAEFEVPSSLLENWKLPNRDHERTDSCDTKYSQSFLARDPDVDRRFWHRLLVYGLYPEAVGGQDQNR